MKESADLAFEIWLQGLVTQGYEPLWIVNNMPYLRRRYVATRGAPMNDCPAPESDRPIDRYADLY